MFQRKPGRFRQRSNGRNQRRHGHSRPQRSNFRRNDRNHKRNGDASKFKSHFPSKDGFQRTVPSRNNYNASKLVEKYNNLAKEALSSGDKILSENYLQHVDHFERLVSLKNANQNEKSSQDLNVTKEQNNEADSDSQNNQGTIDKK